MVLYTHRVSVLCGLLALPHTLCMWMVLNENDDTNLTQTYRYSSILTTIYERPPVRLSPRGTTIQLLSQSPPCGRHSMPWLISTVNGSGHTTNSSLWGWWGAREFSLSPYPQSLKSPCVHTPAQTPHRESYSKHNPDRCCFRKVIF